jgi:hypothetical protein
LELSGGITTDLFGIGDGEENRTTRQTNKTETTSGNRLAKEDQSSINARSYQEGEIPRLAGQLDQYFSQAKGDSDQINQLFKQALTKFATGTGQPSPDQLQQATQYVDQTFTNPAQTQYNRFLDQAQNKISGRAAQLGRTSSDAGYTREFASQAGAAAENLSNQRGSLIGQRADYLANQLPQNQLSSLYSGAQYFNAPVNQAIGNRLALLNSATGVQSLGLARQQAGGQQYSNSNQAGSQILPDASLSTKFYNAGNAWNQNNSAQASTLGSFYKMGG